MRVEYEVKGIDFYFGMFLKIKCLKLDGGGVLQVMER